MGDQSSTRPTLRHTESVNRYREVNTPAVCSSSLEIRLPRRVPHPWCSPNVQIIEQHPQTHNHDKNKGAPPRPSSAKSMNSSSAPAIPIATSFACRSDTAMHTLLEYRAGKLHRPVDGTAAGRSPASTVCHHSGTSAMQNGHVQAARGGEHESRNGAVLSYRLTNSRDALRFDQVAIHNDINSSCTDSQCEPKAALSDSLQKVHLDGPTEDGALLRNGTCETRIKFPSSHGPSTLEKRKDVVGGPVALLRSKSLPQDCPQHQQSQLCHYGPGLDYLSSSGSAKDGCAAHQNGSGQDSIDSNLSSSSGSSSTTSSSRQWQEINALKMDNGIKYEDEDDDDDDSGFFLQENDFDEDTFDETCSLEASFAGRRNYLMPERVICGETGTIRGMKNRVRAGIETFHQQTEGKKNFHHLETSKVVVYTTSNGIVRETFQKCLKVKMILSTLLVPFEERDIFKYRGYQRELAERLNANHLTIPQVFLAGDYLGDSKIIEDLNELGRLRKILRPYKRPGAQVPCQKCGGYKLIICSACNGSKKSVHRNCFTENSMPLRCSKCDECGLTRCDLCCKVKADREVINK